MFIFALISAENSHADPAVGRSVGRPCCWGWMCALVELHQYLKRCTKFVLSSASLTLISPILAFPWDGTSCCPSVSGQKNFLVPLSLCPGAKIPGQTLLSCLVEWVWPNTIQTKQKKHSQKVYIIKWTGFSSIVTKWNTELWCQLTSVQVIFVVDTLV